MGLFGDFTDICTRTPFPFCSVLSSTSDLDNYFDTGILPTCYSRAVELSNTMIYQVGNSIINIGGLLVCLIIIFNIRSKYTAILRSEMLIFYYIFTGLLILTLVVDCGVAPPGKPIYGYFVSAQIGLAGSTCWALLFNGCLCYQLWEDGTKKSLWSLRITSFLIFALHYVIAILTFKGWAGDSISKTHATGLFVTMFIINAVMLFVYVVSQIFLSIFVLSNYWALGSILLGSLFFIIGQIMLYVFSKKVCDGLNHYLDGLFFGSLFNIFTVMMVYKYWDIITSEDLEFSVATQETGVAFNNPYGNNNNRASRVIYSDYPSEEKLNY